MPFFLEKSLANEIHSSPFSDIIPFAAARCHHQGKCLVCREGRRVIFRLPQTAALSGVNCTVCVAPLRGLVRWDYCHDVACGGMRCVPANNAMMLRAAAMPTVGGYGPVRWHLPSERIFAHFPSVESVKKNLYLCTIKI